MNNYDTKYEDIIKLPHHVSKRHPQMSLEARSAQFAPFAALTGYEDVVKETARLTNEKKEITEEVKAVLDERIQIIQKNICTKPKVICTYFEPDKKKNGGKYITIEGRVQKIDKYNHVMVLEDKTEIKISEIIQIEL